MKDLIIEYREGKLTQLRVDGVLMEGVTSLGFSHFAGKASPELTFNLAMTGQESLIAPDIDRKTFESAAKRFTEADAVVVLTPTQSIARAVQETIAKRLSEEVKPGGILHRK